MKIRAVAEVGKHVLFIRERRLSHPCDAFGAHVGKCRRFAVHPQHHVVAADAGQRARAFRYFGGTVVRAAGTEERRAVLLRIGFHADRFQHILFGFQVGDALLHALLDGVTGVIARDAAGDRARDHGRVQFIRGRQQPVAVSRALLVAPFARVVELADHARTLAVFEVVQLFLQRVFEDLPLFFHHEDFVEALGEFMHAVRFQRPGHADLVQADADVGRRLLVDAEIGQRLARVQIRFAGRDDADARLRAVPDDLVELVGTRIRQRRIPFVAVHAHFLFQHRVGPADVQATGRHLEVGRQGDLHAVRVEIDGGARLDDVGHAFHRHPQARVAAHGPRVQAVVDVFLHRRRVQHGDAAGVQDMVGLVRRGRGFRRMVVAGQHQHAAVLGGTGVIGVLEDVAAAVDAGALAVPHAEHAVVFRVFEQIRLLRAPDGRGGQVFVQARMEFDVVFIEVFLGLDRRHVDGRHRRTAVTGDVAGRIQASLQIALALQHGQADQRLRARHEGAATLQGVFVVQGNFGRVRARLKTRALDWCIHYLSPLFSVLRVQSRLNSHVPAALYEQCRCGKMTCLS